MMKNLVQIERMSKDEFWRVVAEIDARKTKNLNAATLPLDKLSKRFAENIVTPADVPVPDCQNCGACCAFALCVPVALADETERENYWEITLDETADAPIIDRYLRRDEKVGVCASLAGEIGAAVGCRIYKTRPRLCHDFEAGSDRCHAYRRMYKLEKELTGAEIATAFAKLKEVEETVLISYVQIVEDSVIHRFVFGGGQSEQSKTRRMKIFVYFGGDETPHELHAYDPAEETWFESEFLGMNRAEANAAVGAPRH